MKPPRCRTTWEKAFNRRLLHHNNKTKTLEEKIKMIIETPTRHGFCGSIGRDFLSNPIFATKEYIRMKKGSSKSLRADPYWRLTQVRPYKMQYLVYCLQAIAKLIKENQGEALLSDNKGLRQFAQLCIEDVGIGEAYETYLNQKRNYFKNLLLTFK